MSAKGKAKPSRKKVAVSRYDSSWLQRLTAAANTGAGARGRKMSDERIAEALRRCHGNLSRTGAMLGVTHSAISQRIADSEVLQAVREEAGRITGDLAEDVVMHAMKQGDTATARWHLEKSKEGRERGYGISATVAITEADAKGSVGALGTEAEGYGLLMDALAGAAPEEHREVPPSPRSRKKGRAS